MDLTRRDLMKRAAIGAVAGVAMVGTGQGEALAASRPWPSKPHRSVDIENWLLSTVPRI